MIANIHCPNCREPIEVALPVINNPYLKRGDFQFTCPMCGVRAILEIQFSTNDKEFINAIPNPQNCKCQIQLPGGVKDKIDKAIIKPEIDAVDGQPILWVSNKLGFLGSKKKHQVS